MSDKEIIELHALCSALVDGTLDEAGRGRLQARLRESDEARRYYVLSMGLSASLHHFAGETLAEAPDLPALVRPHSAYWRWSAWLAAAAALAVGVFIGTHSRRAPGTAPAPAAIPAAFVARITGANGCRWADGAPLTVGSRIRKDQQLDLAAGFAEVTFDSGAQVVLEGPAVLDVTSPWDGTLRRGALRAYVPPEAIGFRISHPSVEVLDLGTEFSMVADATSADVLVTKGEVEAAPRDASDQDGILLKATQSRRFASTGIAPVGAAGAEFASIGRPVVFQRFVAAPGYVHWSFSRTLGGVCPADAVGIPIGREALMLCDLPAGVAPLVAEADRPEALAFDGTLYASAPFPGLSGNTPHTVAFWVKVPADAPLLNSYAMVAWGTTGRKFASRPVEISWNRTPAEGPLGALRTDFGGGSAIGATSLRDGRWHHVAVVFIPGGNRSTPVQVQQYVDGRLDSSEVNPPGHTVRLSSKQAISANLKDTVWLGCRLSTKGIKHDRFRGELAELFIADRTLEPREIVALMRNDRLPSAADVASAAP